MLLYIKNIEDKTLKYQNYSFIYMLKSLHSTVYYTYSVLYIYILLYIYTQYIKKEICQYFFITDKQNINNIYIKIFYAFINFILSSNIFLIKFLKCIREKKMIQNYEYDIIYNLTDDIR